MAEWGTACRTTLPSTGMISEVWPAQGTGEMLGQTGREARNAPPGNTGFGVIKTLKASQRVPHSPLSQNAGGILRDISLCLSLLSVKYRK